MKLTKIVLGLVSLLSLSTLVTAQQESSLPILHLPTDTRLASMGNAAIGEADGMYLYSNPTSLLEQSTKLNVSVSSRIYDKNLNGHNLYFFDGAINLRLGRHGIFAGGRHWRGPKIPRVNSEGIEGKSIPLNEATMDLGYAFRFNDHLSAFTSGSYIFSYFGKKTQTAVFNLGVYYRGKALCAGHEFSYLIGSRMMNFGPQFKYGKTGRKINVPASWDMGAEIGTAISADYRCSLLGGVKYNFLPLRAKSLGGYVGGEVSYKDDYKGSIGYNMTKGYPDIFTAGASARFSKLRLGMVYQHVSIQALSNLSGTLSVSF